MTVTLQLKDEPGLRHVAHHMREWDRREIFARRYDDDPEAIVQVVVGARFPWWVARVDGVPASACGVLPTEAPGVWAPWCFGTEMFARTALVLTRHGKRFMMPAVRNAGGHRLEVRSLDGHDDAHRWLERTFGAKREGTHPKAGRAGETFHTYGLIL